MKVLAFDTETTGLPLWSKSSSDPGQPHIVQFAAIMWNDEADEELRFVDVLVKPDGWTIPPEMTAIHGITNEVATEKGHPEGNVIACFVKLASEADRLVAYNVSFDLRIARIAMMRAGYAEAAVGALSDLWNQKKQCVMLMASPLCKLPPTDRMMASGRKTLKNPTLTEAVQIILGETIEGAHDAAADVMWTKRLWQHMTRKPQEVPAPDEMEVAR
jgi:DNA polymerase-3 subunit epsilon